MHDLELYRRLASGRLGLDLVPGLRALGERPLEDRIAFLGVLEPALRAEQAELRAAALSVLGGARGMAGLRAMVSGPYEHPPRSKRLASGLDDNEATVRRAAVEALRETACRHQPQRFVHALFHPREDVRQAALRGQVPDEVRPLCFYLWADPACRLFLEGVPLPKGGLPVLFEFMRAGFVSTVRGRGLLLRAPKGELLAWIREGEQRSEGEWSDTLRDGAVRGADVLDELLGTCWDDSESSERVLALVRSWVLEGGTPGLAGRVAAACLARWVGDGNIPAAAAGLWAICEPRALLRGWTPQAVEAAFQALHLERDRLGKRPDDEVQLLLLSPCMRLPDGDIDPWRLAVVLWLAEKPWELYFAHVDANAVRRACRRAPERASWLLLLPFETPDRLRGLLLSLSNRDAARAHALTAWSLAHQPSDRLDSLRPLLRSNLAGPLLLLLELLRDERVVLTRDRLEPLASLFVGELFSVRAVGNRCQAELLAFVSWFLGRDRHGVLARLILGRIIRRMSPSALLATLDSLPGDSARALLLRRGEALGVGAEELVGLSHFLARHADPEIRRTAGPPFGLALPGGCRDRALVEIGDQDRESLLRRWRALHSLVWTPVGVRLGRVVTPYRSVPSRGLAVAINQMSLVPQPDIDVCLALLGCHDELPLVDRAFAIHESREPSWLRELDIQASDAWAPQLSLPLVGHAWLSHLDWHATCALAAMVQQGLAKSLLATQPLISRSLRPRIWAAAARGLELAEPRHPGWVRSLFEPDLERVLLAQRDSEYHEPAARMHSVFRRVREATTVPMMPPSSACSSEPATTDLEAARTSTDLDWLQQACESEEESLVQAAAARLVGLGEEGQDRLCDLLLRVPTLPRVGVLCAGVEGWVEGSSLQRLRASLSTCPARVRFLVALVLGERGESHWLDVCIDALLVPGEGPWLGEVGWSRLVRLASCQRSLALALVSSPQPFVVDRVVSALSRAPAPDAEVEAALVDFLELEEARPLERRVEAATWLMAVGDQRGFPLLLPKLLAGELPNGTSLLRDEPNLSAAHQGVLMAGPKWEGGLVDRLLQDRTLDSSVKWGDLLGGLADPRARERVVSHVSQLDDSKRKGKLAALSDVFEWGAQHGAKLLRRPVKVRMTKGRGELGFTRMGSSSIYVSPVPMLSGYDEGRQVVEGLVLHELGHQRYHHGAAERRVWLQARSEGLHPLLNLVADEHLERKLRSEDQSYGHRFHALASYAFQHAPREHPVSTLVRFLCSSSFDVLTRVQLELAWRPDCVRVQGGYLLRAMEANGQSFARFLRALRQGLGNRSGDPKVEQALALFDKRFKGRSMAELLDIARQLRDIFGPEADASSQLGSIEQLGKVEPTNPPKAADTGRGDAVPEGGDDDGDDDGDDLDDPEEDTDTRPGDRPSLWEESVCGMSPQPIGREDVAWVPGGGWQLEPPEEADDRVSQASSEERDYDVHGGDITDDDIEREVQRIFETPQPRPPPPEPATRGWRVLNLGPEERFDRIREIRTVEYDAAEARKLRHEVSRHARHIRSFLEELGLRYEPVGARTKGLRVDRARLRPLVTRGDPRLLMAREPVVRTDLFLGLAVDCSSSMCSDRSMEKAKLFAALLAEAARGLRGVDLKVIGFTDCVIWDAGDAARCAVSNLRPSGMNNDAAALAHLADLAASSRRKARLLVMISDGSPSGCTVTALRALVLRLERQGLCVAQVAVQPLDERCFRHYVELDGEELDVAVRRFGNIMVRLVRRAVRR